MLQLKFGKLIKLWNLRLVADGDGGADDGGADGGCGVDDDDEDGGCGQPGGARQPQLRLGADGRRHQQEASLSTKLIINK